MSDAKKKAMSLSRKEFGAILNFRDVTKDNIKNAKEFYNDKIENGELDPLQVLVGIKTFKDVFIGDDKNPGVEKLARKLAVDEVDKFGKERCMVGNFELRTQEVGTKYDYSKDAIWRNISDEVFRLTEKMKDREALLKTVKLPDRTKNEQNEFHTDPDTGETYEVMPPIKTSTTTVICTLKH